MRVRGTNFNSFFVLLLAIASFEARGLVGGSYVKSGKFASVVGVTLHFEGTSNDCTAVLVGKKTLLSADHCIYSDPTKVDVSKRMRVNSQIDLYQNYADSSLQKKKTVTLQMIQSSNDRGEVLNEFDVKFDQADFSVLTLSEELSDFFGVSELANYLSEEDFVTVVGAGNQFRNEAPQENSTPGPTGILKFFEDKVSLLTRPRAHIQYLPKKLGQVTHGDSGGPLFVKDADGEFRVAGIVSKYSYPGNGDDPDSYSSQFSRVDGMSRFGKLARQLIQRSESSLQIQRLAMLSLRPLE